MNRSIVIACLAGLAACGGQCEPRRDAGPPPPGANGSKALELVGQLREHVAAGRTDAATLDPLLVALRTELERLDAEHEAMRDELERQREAIQRYCKAELVSEIDIRFYTRLLDESGDGVADGLLAAVTPRDSLGNPLRTPGRMMLELTRKNILGGPGKVLQTWTFEPDEAAARWRGEAVVFPGYEFTLSLDESARENLGRGDPVLRVTFTPTGGEPIQAQRTVKGVVQ